MNILEYAKYRKVLSELDLQGPRNAIEEMLQQVASRLNTYNVDFKELKTSIQSRSDTILNEIDALKHEVDQFNLCVKESVDIIEVPLVNELSEKIYQEGINDDYDYKLDRDRFKTLLHDEETRSFFVGRVAEYIDWKYSALHLGPRLGDTTEHLVSCDPLYLVDEHVDMFKEVKKLFTPEYQRRLRYYTIDETKEDILHELPDNQLGLVVAVDYFNFRPMRIIKQYLASIFSILQPGGVAVFTYNNCNYPIGIDNFRNSYYTYTPGHLVKEACTQHGFNILASFDMEKNVSWLEIQKPGTRNSIKGGQSLGAIKHLIEHTGENK